MHKYVQKKLDEENEINARYAATVAFNDVLGSGYLWPVNNYLKVPRLSYDTDGVLPKEFVDLLIKGELAEKYPRKHEYTKVQDKFNEQFVRYEQAAKERIQNNLKHIIYGTVVAVVIVTIMTFWVDWNSNHPVSSSPTNTCSPNESSKQIDPSTGPFICPDKQSTNLTLKPAIVSLSSPITPGSGWTMLVMTLPNTNCGAALFNTAYVDENESHLMETSTISGDTFFAWNVPVDQPPGYYPVAVDCRSSDGDDESNTATLHVISTSDMTKFYAGQTIN